MIFLHFPTSAPLCASPFCFFFLCSYLLQPSLLRVVDFVFFFLLFLILLRYASFLPLCPPTFRATHSPPLPPPSFGVFFSFPLVPIFAIFFSVPFTSPQCGCIDVWCSSPIHPPRTKHLFSVYCFGPSRFLQCHRTPMILLCSTTPHLFENFLLVRHSPCPYLLCYLQLSMH